MRPNSSGKHHSTTRIVIAVQSLVIFLLTLWIVEDYLNNLYLREYISGVIQADGLMIGGILTLLALGSATGIIFVKRMHGQKGVGAVSLGITPPHPRLKIAAPASSKPVVSGSRPSELSTRPSESSNKPSESSTKPSTDFHPVVAALKADMADRRLSFGSLVSAGFEQPATTPAPSGESPKTSVLEQLAPHLQPPVTGPRPEQTITPAPQQPLHDLRPQQPTGPTQMSASVPHQPLHDLRPQQTSSPGVEHAGPLMPQHPMPILSPQQPSGPRLEQSGSSIPQRPLPVLRPQTPTGPRVEPAGTSQPQRPMSFLKPQEPAKQAVPQLSQPASRPSAPQIPTNVTTVITGIVPAQKKKDPAATTEEKPSPSK